MALQVAEGPVVAEHVEAVPGALERPARLVPPVVTLADVGGQQRSAFVGSEPAHPLDELRLGSDEYG